MTYRAAADFDGDRRVQRGDSFVELLIIKD